MADWLSLSGIRRVSAKIFGKSCLVYASVPHLGFGWVQACVSILENFPRDVLLPTLVIPRSFRSISPSVTVKEALPPALPFQYAAPIVRPALNFRFKRALAAANPRDTIIYFWPEPPISLVKYARKRGFITVREMINTAKGTAKIILKEAYDRLGLHPPSASEITNESVTRESEELHLHDYILSPNPRIESSLIEIGIDRAKILRSSYGWSPLKYASSIGEEGRKGFRALFIGGDTVRKGLPQLLVAWKKSGVTGQLFIVGNIDAQLKKLFAPYLQDSSVRTIDFEFDLGRLYKSADVFIFPSLEEGDPQVTYEAAGCGLPVIATSMGSANIIKDGEHGLLVNAYDVDGLAAAIYRVASSPKLRKYWGLKAAQDAQHFTYDKIGEERARMLHKLLIERSR